MKASAQHNQCQCSLGAGTDVEKTNRKPTWSDRSKEALALVNGLLSSGFLGLLWAYQMTRYLRQPSCRFYPSCSQYMVDGIKRFGPIRGLILGLMRLLRCIPFGPGGYDPVPGEFPGAIPAKITSAGRLLRRAVLPVGPLGVVPVGFGDQRRGKR